jgi:4-carboxymuconolactone decarboxylase
MKTMTCPTFSIRLCVLLLMALPMVAQDKSSLPRDIDPVTLSRLPPVSAGDLDEEGKRLLAARTNYTPGPGPAHVSIYSPREVDLGIPSGAKSPVGPRYFQIAVLITAREIDQQYEWTAHELAGRRQGLEQAVIDVVKYNKDVASLSDKDATLITFGRALFREHRVSSELWGSMVSQFGRQRTVQLMMIMGEYFKAGFMMNAVDQHLPPGREALLPPLNK